VKEPHYRGAHNGNDNVEIRLLQLDASRSATNDDRTRPERRCSPDFRAGRTRAYHGEPFSVALAAGPLAGPVQAGLSRALNLLREVLGNYESRQLRSSTSRSPIFVVDGLSLPLLRTKLGERARTCMPTRLRGTLYSSANNLKHFQFGV